MFQPLYVAATGLDTIQDEILDITNNLANAKTVGFKKGRAEMESLFYVEKSFKDMLYEEISGSENTPVNVEYGTGVRIASTPKDHTQGAIEVTNNPLDLAVQGEGFFVVRMPDGSPAYTRAGNFRVDDAGNLVNPNGRILEPGVVIPSDTTSVTISQDGTIMIARNNEKDLTEVGQLTLARFTNKAGLKSLGQNIYQMTEASGEPVLGVANADGYGSINQYSLEQSNVDVISEMMRMVMAQRVFDTVTKAVQSYEGMLASLDKMKQ
ncbi:flagellar basal-body rod protein FlgG [candidate division WOR-1 bacterium RIFOXYA12_FULL_52_29]|uniref:Flagellar basal-body rod protein FlgG n=1 Tax=candidate division WOR-1 bacterium RIFOXYC12_FULL_54_18 TaxID=1802584 RepID=A0A1F4T537_UNCSA|nr:MAG: flagellar basal-body rod protein FlgG [candidate division WOR-1 bacterium RIFOXYA2_FULL_51_19]OGC17498.1 MAG: flagellar basal-body rod protein FlgG [candidate division WOR-1 bacterium RIFOXYA12_FULL_52_29]OGC26355.1 MAG: flagellar basal-body rod protein FlgG [candidate division WOR-1 bacterium RIFOXYB2_FULL_45_9]OGC27915.1 MAG: flagellar basal-body rod protein FlgG [candidate division WOR-1 bacterium RIFOXYC12_FULL_54_18]OGC29798.1 MAG: flagellar basal-body rod protein FlgG [candidate d